MSKLNQIQNALFELDGGKFQKLGDSYIHCKGYRNLNSIGSVIGADKVRVGTPDTFARQKNGRLVFVEHSTQKENLSKKIKSDLRKCLDESKTGVPVTEIEEIIFCHTSRLKPDEVSEIIHIGKSRGIEIQIWGIDDISLDLTQQYPGIALEFLNIEIDTGQILSLEDFIKKYEKNKFSTPLSTEILFREEEIIEGLRLLERDDLIILSGPAGVGKTRLALEVLRSFKEKFPEYQSYCVFNRTHNIFEDLKVYFSKLGNYIILVDDANRISHFDYFVHLLQDQNQNSKIKIIATVRDYALDSIERSVKPFGYVPIIKVSRMEKDKIREIIKKLYDINNPHWLERISDISGGNPRLAIMSAMVAIKDDDLQSLGDASSIYENYFSFIREDLEELRKDNLLKVSCVISFYRVVDKSNEDLMAEIFENFELDSISFWDGARQLHEFELVDIYENEVVKISDQVLATYLFYLCVFKNKVLSFSTFIEKCFPRQIDRIRDSVYPCLNSFDVNRIMKEMRPVVVSQWKTKKEIGNHDYLLQLIESFWFLLESESLAFFRDWIELLMEEKPIEFSSLKWESPNSDQDIPRLLKLLCLFRHGEETSFSIALDLILLFLQKNPEATPQVIKIIEDKLGFNHRSDLFGYKYQEILVNKLIARTKGGADYFFTKLFLTLAKTLLRTKFTSSGPAENGITIYNFSLLPNQPIFELRRKIWAHIFNLYETPDFTKEVIRVFRSYCSGFELNVADIVKNDSEILFPFIEERFDESNFAHCLIVQKYAKFIKRFLGETHEKLIIRFNSESYQIYKLLILDYDDRLEGVSPTDQKKLNWENLREYTQNFDFEDYKNFLEACIEICDEIDGGRRDWEFSSSLIATFRFLAERDSRLYSEVVSHYLSLGDPFGSSIYPISFVEELVKACGPQKAWEVINNCNYPSKQKWLSAYFQVIPKETCAGITPEKLLSIYKESDIEDIPFDYDYLLQFQNRSFSPVLEVTRILLDRFESDSRLSKLFDLLFNSCQKVNKNLIPIFKNQPAILKKAYLLHERGDGAGDYNGVSMDQILEMNPGFLIEHMKFICEDNEIFGRYDNYRDYSFLWKRSDVEPILLGVIHKIAEIDDENKIYIYKSYLEKLFCISDSQEPSQEVQQEQNQFIENVINNFSHEVKIMILVFCMISKFKSGRKFNFVKIFLEKNNKFDDFNELPFEPRCRSWCGSEVPILSERIEFYQSLLPLFKTAEFLDHKIEIDRIIVGLQKRLETAKKSDFMRD